MTERILELAADAGRRERLGRAGREYVVANHAWDRNAMAIVDVYDRLATASRGGGQSAPLRGGG
jgi:glycosyltransferase involved in cell wall biosynthesis